MLIIVSTMKYENNTPICHSVRAGIGLRCFTRRVSEATKNLSPQRHAAISEELEILHYVQNDIESAYFRGNRPYILQRALQRMKLRCGIFSPLRGEG